MSEFCRRFTIAIVFVGLAARPAAFGAGDDVVEIGSRRELFVDRLLIDELRDVSLKLHEPRLLPASDSPRSQGHYATVIKDGDLFRLYSRGDKVPGLDWRSGWERYHENEFTKYAESKDGRRWTEPDLGLHRIDGVAAGNVVVADLFLITHNFTPFIDERPGVPRAERYKALGGTAYQTRFHEIRERRQWPGGLYALASPDGLRWRLLREKPVVPESWGTFDSQNVAFWSAAEGVYVCYFRVFRNGLRSIARTTSADFVHWTEPVAMRANRDGEHLYTSGVHPYFRAPHLYIALPTRFMAQRGSITDIVFMTTRPGRDSFDRTFREAFIRPGLGPGGWGNRSNYAAYHVVPTSSSEMSIYVYGGRQFTLRSDGFSSVNAGADEGELLTKPLRFQGDRLEVNYATSAAGKVRMEIQDESGNAVPGYRLGESRTLYGDEIQHVVQWTGGADVGPLAGKPVRLRFVLQEADLYSLKFFTTGEEGASANEPAISSLSGNP